MITYNIYALIDSRDNSIFYVGATKSTLKQRLNGHKNSFAKCKSEWSIVNKRAGKIKEILESGGDVLIKLLKKCNEDKVDYYEEKYYNKYVSNGFDLFQDKNRFNLSKRQQTPPLKKVYFAHSIDINTKRRFKNFCDSINIYPSTALNILLNEALDAREIN